MGKFATAFPVMLEDNKNNPAIKPAAKTISESLDSKKEDLFFCRSSNLATF